MAKKKAKRTVEHAPSTLLEKAKPKRTHVKTKRPAKLTGEKLLSLADKHKPPQSWYEEDLDGI